MAAPTPYDQAFYDEQIDGSRASAAVVVERLAAVLAPRSVLDIGCGRGAWLAAWGERGASRLVGIDGPWNRGAGLLHPAIEFRAADLEAPPRLQERFDLAMSIEVVEHLSPAAGDAVVGALCDAADAVLFSAAMPGQGGVHHIHERWPSHWAARFAARGFAAHDALRPALWGDERVMPWHRANAFVYLREGHPAAAAWPRVAPAFMDAVHPWLYERSRVGAIGFRDHLREIVPSLFRALKRRA